VSEEEVDGPDGEDEVAEEAAAPLAARFDLKVEAGEAGERLDRWLGRKLRPTYSRSFLVRRIEEGAVLVNGKEVRASYPIEAGDAIAVDATPADRTPKAEPIELKVLYEDEHLIAIDKPIGMLVHPGVGGQTGTLVNALLHRHPQVATVGSPDRPGIVHRLDRDTTGVMICALSNQARWKLVQQFKTRVVKKEYRAVVVGKVALQSDYIDLPIAQDFKHPERQKIDLEHGKPSSTFYDVVERLPGYTHVRAHPLTGRTHQIRIHLAHLGHPCVADPLYGRQAQLPWRRLLEEREAAGRPVPAIRRQALHAFRIRFVHPVDGREISVESPLAPDMLELLEFLRSLRA
jgi:23S rRNA pseudouridine1911/1915/1917 synthase